MTANRTLHTVDRHLFQCLDDKEQDRITAGIEALGLSLKDCREAYTDETGKVVGALRLLRDEDGQPYVATERVGETP